MKDKTFNFIRNIIRKSMNEDFSIPTNSASSGAISGLSGKEGDLPPIDLRRKKYRKLSSYYKDIFKKKK